VITIDPDLFEYDEGLGYSLETFVVSSDFDPAAVMNALARAATRFMHVGDNGAEDLDLEEAAQADIYTPNYVSDPRITEAGVEVYVDAKGAIDPPMAATLRRVLQEELGAAVPAARVDAVR
jgi:hypothetical protein